MSSALRSRTRNISKAREKNSGSRLGKFVQSIGLSIARSERANPLCLAAGSSRWRWRGRDPGNAAIRKLRLRAATRSYGMFAIRGGTILLAACTFFFLLITFPLITTWMSRFARSPVPCRSRRNPTSAGSFGIGRQSLAGRYSTVHVRPVNLFVMNDNPFH